MKIVREFLILLLVSAFFIGTNMTANAAENWAADPKTGCQIAWVSDTDTLVSASWTGPTVNGKAEGKGILMVAIRDKDGKENNGQANAQMKAGKLDGKVSIKWFDGSSFDGLYKDGLREGKGISRFSNGAVYDGDFKNDKHEGNGIFKYSNGAVYEGGFKDDKCEGKCVFKFPNGEVYEGDYKNNVMAGKGVYKWPNGQVYEGDFKNGQMDGKGVLRFPNGQTYEGDFRDGKLNGSGVLKDPGGKVMYEGQWKDGQRGTGQDISDEVRKHLNWGRMALETAKTPMDIKDAMEEFNIAIKLAPDCADAYYRLGVVQEMVNKDDDAMKNLKKYLELAPDGATVKEARQLIDKLEYKVYKKDKARKKEEEKNRIEKYGANFEYTPPLQEAPDSGGVTFAVGKPVYNYQPDSKLLWYKSPQFANLRDAVRRDLSAIFTAKGFSVRGHFDSYDLIPYSDKKAIDLYLIPTIELSVNPPVDVYSIDDINIDVTGKITLELREPVTGKVMWTKNIPFTEFDFLYIIQEITWKNLADIHDVANKEIKKTINSLEYGTVNINDLAEGIAKQYPDLMSAISKLIDPEEMRIIKKQCQELKSKK